MNEWTLQEGLFSRDAHSICGYSHMNTDICTLYVTEAMRHMDSKFYLFGQNFLIIQTLCYTHKQTTKGHLLSEVDSPLTVPRQD